jgi:protein arginine kinase activator
MLCDFCKKNIATIHLIRVQNDKVEKVNICSECAKNFSFFSEEDFFRDLSDILYRIFEYDTGKAVRPAASMKMKKLDAGKNRVCPFCGMDLRTIKKTGKIGCAHCYSEFKSILTPIIKDMHRDVEYRGRVPENSSRWIKIEKNINELRHRLKNEIFIENFEEAARIRDKIKQLEKNIYE